jgi:hypothetical protein
MQRTFHYSAYLNIRWGQSESDPHFPKHPSHARSWKAESLPWHGTRWDDRPHLKLKAIRPQWLPSCSDVLITWCALANPFHIFFHLYIGHGFQSSEYSDSTPSKSGSRCVGRPEVRARIQDPPRKIYYGWPGYDSAFSHSAVLASSFQLRAHSHDRTGSSNLPRKVPQRRYNSTISLPFFQTIWLRQNDLT